MHSLPTSNKSSRRPMFFQFAGALLLMLGTMWSASPLYADTINVPAGDSGALLDAIRLANQSSEVTIIHLDSHADYKLNLSSSAPEPISAHIIIQGEGAHLVGEGDQSFGPLFVVLEQGSLELSDIVVRDFDSGEDDSVDSGDGLITVRGGGLLKARDLRFERIHARSTVPILGGIFSNWGRLDLDRVRIIDVSISVNSEGIGLSSIAIHNSGIARLQNLLIVDGKGYDAISVSPEGPYIRNFAIGKLELRFSTLILESEPTGSLSRVRALAAEIFGIGGLTPETRIAGSMIVDMECPLVASPIISEGFNLFTDDACTGGPTGPSTNDLVGVSPGALKFRLASDGGVKVILPRGSPALDGVKDPTFSCPGKDAVSSTRPQGANQDGLALCDIGAFEASGGQPLFAGGANGVFYSVNSDGHYVTIQEVSPNVYVVFWNTFDLDGNQAWIWAMGNRESDVITAEAYILPVGILIPGSGADVDTETLHSWGTVSVQLLGCLGGQFTYESGLVRFGSGSFHLDRLAVVEGLGCQD